MAEPWFMGCIFYVEGQNGGECRHYLHCEDLCNGCEDYIKTDDKDKGTVLWEANKTAVEKRLEYERSVSEYESKRWKLLYSQLTEPFSIFERCPGCGREIKVSWEPLEHYPNPRIITCPYEECQRKFILHWKAPLIKMETMTQC